MSRGSGPRCLPRPLHPAHVVYSRLLATPSACLQHAGIRIERRYLAEQLSQGQRQDARSAADIE